MARGNLISDQTSKVRKNKHFVWLLISYIKPELHVYQTKLCIVG